MLISYYFLPPSAIHSSCVGLSLTIPTEIGKLTNLVFLDLDYNELTGTIPSTLYLLTNLETLDLNDNFLEGDIDSIGVLNKLEFLQLQST